MFAALSRLEPVHNLEAVLKRAWSIRFLAAAMMFDLAQASVSFWSGSDLVSPMTLTLANLGLGMAGFVARCIAQPGVTTPKEDA